MLWSKNNSSINIYNTNNNKMRKGIFWCDKNSLMCFFPFTVPIIAVRLQNVHAKFHNVVYTYIITVYSTLVRTLL